MPCYLYKHVDIIQNLFLGSELDLLTPLGAGIAGSLADFCQVSIGEPPGHLGQVGQFTSLATGLFLRLDLRIVIRQGNV